MELYEMLLEVTFFIIVSYFLFYRSFLKELGKKTAELATSKQLTESVEDVKAKFNKEIESFKGDIQKDVAKEIEPFKATLNKENIGFQIYTSEYAKLRFQRLDELFATLYKFQRFVIDQLIPFNYKDEKDFADKKESFHLIYYEAFEKISLAGLYLDEDGKNATYELVNNCHSAFLALIKYKNSLPHDNTFYLPDLRTKMINDNSEAVDKFEAARKKFPEILLKIENEFKRHLYYEKSI